MKQYSILDNSGQVTGHIQVDNDVPYSELIKVYPGLVEGYHEISQSTVDPTEADQTRLVRNQLLAAVDRINPVWWNSLTPQQQQELIVYRQALLDVPQQSGFPTAVSWPAKPAWL
jgi:hypothetical protein